VGIVARSKRLLGDYLIDDAKTKLRNNIQSRRGRRGASRSIKYVEKVSVCIECARPDFPRQLHDATTKTNADFKRIPCLRRTTWRKCSLWNAHRCGGLRDISPSTARAIKLAKGFKRVDCEIVGAINTHLSKGKDISAASRNDHLHATVRKGAPGRRTAGAR
jgi:hypothetical protein